MPTRVDRHADLNRAVIAASILSLAMGSQGAVAVVHTPYVFPITFNATVWQAVLEGAGLAGRPWFGEEWSFEPERMEWAQAILLLGILFLGDVEMRSNSAHPTRSFWREWDERC